MTSTPTAHDTAEPASDTVDRPLTLRLRLKPKTITAVGRVDGGWWPRSRELAVELPGLLAVLAVRLGPIERVSYQLAEWNPTVRRISFPGGVVRLAGYRSQAPNTVDVIAEQQRITLLVVPPETAAPTAHDVLMAAGHRGNTDDVESLLSSTGESHVR